MRVAEAAQISALEGELAVERERCRRLEAQLRNLADHDPLTDLLNRRSVEHELEQHLARCTRYGPDGALLLVGLDGLDRITGALGQQWSDEALAALAERVANRLRATDVVGRWGPDQLAVLLPGAGVPEVAVVAEALVAIVASTGTSRVQPGSVVASIGVALVGDAPVGAGQRHRPVRAQGTVARAAIAMIAARRRGGGWAMSAG